MTKNTSQKISFLAAALMALTLAIMPIAAQAAPGLPGEGLPETNQKGKLTIHKYATSAPSQVTGTGLELSANEAATLGTPLKDVGFTLFSVNDQAALIKAVNDAGTGKDIDPLTYKGAVFRPEAKTDASGVIAWDQIPVGYYVLEETTPPAGKYDKAAPTIITMPFGYTNDGYGWNYDLHVYPKNVRQANVSKELTAGPGAYYTAGDEQSWVITGKVLEALFAAPGTYGSFRVIDQLDSRLDYQSTLKVMATGGKAVNGGNGSVELAAADYDVTAPSAANNNTVTWALKESGIKKIADIDAKAVRIEFKTKVNDSAQMTDNGAAAGVDVTRIVNNATVEQKGANGTPNKDNIDDKVEPLPGFDVAHLIVKAREWKKDRPDPDPNEVVLANVEIKIAESIDKAKAGDFIKKGNADGTPGTEDMVVKTNAQGEGIFAGLPIPDKTKDTNFVLVVVSVPQGYIKPQFAYDAVVKANTAENRAVVDIEHKDNPDGPMPGDRPTFKLPKTGGMGTVAFIAVGAVLLLLAVVLFRRSRKEEQNTRTLN